MGVGDGLLGVSEQKGCDVSVCPSVIVSFTFSAGFCPDNGSSAWGGTSSGKAGTISPVRSTFEKANGTRP